MKDKLRGFLGFLGLIEDEYGEYGSTGAAPARPFTESAAADVEPEWSAPSARQFPTSQTNPGALRPLSTPRPSSISVLDGHHIVYVARVPTKRIMTVAISVGTRFPAYCTSMGRVLLAGLSQDDLDRYLAEADLEPITARTVTDPDRLREIVRDVARQGYAIVDQELEEGLRAIAAPIHGAGGAVTAAINVSAHASRVSMAAMRSELLPHMLETARHIETDLRSQGLG